MATRDRGTLSGARGHGQHFSGGLDQIGEKAVSMGRDAFSLMNGSRKKKRPSIGDRVAMSAGCRKKPVITLPHVSIQHMGDDDV
jgi:hypothetical protein